MITVLMGRTSSQSEIDLPNAYHITELPERSDSMIEDLLAAGLAHVVPSRRGGWLGVGRLLLLITRSAVCVHFGASGAAGLHRPDSVEPYLALDLGDKCQRPRGNIALWVLYLLAREVCAISRV